MNNYSYSVIQKLGYSTRWRCSSYCKLNCKAVIYTRGKTVTLVNSHNHEPGLNPETMKYAVKQIVTILPELSMGKRKSTEIK